MNNSEKTVEASYYKKHADGSVKCMLCPHHCNLLIGESGKCKIRTNIEGTLVAEMYGNLSAVHIDPIEKKPLYHFHPGKEILSLGGLGCNFSCDCCQNYHISQSGKKDYPRLLFMSVQDIIKQAKKAADNIGIAYTYNEPSVWYEFMLEISRAAKSETLENAMVSNGYINKKPLMELIKYMDAFNIDLKCFDSDRHKQFTGGELKYVLNTLRSIRKEGKHLEVTHLVIPGINDDPKVFREMVDWIVMDLGPDTPLHISRYFPKYHMEKNATTAEKLLQFAEIAGGKLQYVYLGNLSLHEYQNTICPNCESLVILREGYSTSLVGLSKDGKCKSCGETVAIV